MNQKFLTISTILRESTLSMHDKEELFHISVKLAKKGIHGAIKKSKKKYHKKHIEKQIQKNTKRIYNKMISID